MGQDLVRRFPGINQGFAKSAMVAVLVLVHLHGSFPALVAEPPASLVASLVDRDAREPGLQTALAVEALHAAEDLQKNFLRSIGSVRGVGEDAVHQTVDRLVIAGYEPVVCLF